MKTELIFKAFILFANISIAQVGIGTTNPTADLDINGTLRVRNIPIDNNATKTLVVDNLGNVSVSNNFVLVNTVSDVAAGPVTYSSGTLGATTKNDINLGLSQTMTIPANKTARIVVTYSVPVGINGTEEVEGYLGIRFLKNGVEADSGSRKYTINKRYGTTVQMNTISSIYTEEITTAGTSQNVSYDLNGYIEQYGALAVPTYIFNMWDISPPNYNWGRAALIVQLYLKDN